MSNTKYLLNNPYAIDLGNGHAKRTKDGVSVIVEPSVYIEKDDGYQLDDDIPTVKVNEEEIHIGNDALATNKKVKYIIGDENRYNDIFKEYLFGCIAKDYRRSVTIPLLVVGLPIYHYEDKEVRDSLYKVCKDDKIVTYAGEKYTISISDVLIIPQPIGAYGHLIKTRPDLKNKSILVIDGGHGTLDVTAMQGTKRLDWDGELYGMRNSLIKIRKYLTVEYKLRKTPLYQVENILRNKLMIGNQEIDIKADEEVKKILRKDFKEATEWISERFEPLSDYNTIVLTGGMAHVFDKEFKEEFKNTMSEIVVLDEGQNANVLGFYSFGESIVKKEVKNDDTGKGEENTVQNTKK